jgi:hypothetical protein
MLTTVVDAFYTPVAFSMFTCNKAGGPGVFLAVSELRNRKSNDGDKITGSRLKACKSTN